MEAPIPASALIHSATLVSAGVFLLLKFNWLISTEYLSYIIFFLGTITSLYGGIVAAAQTDCKKLLAYSTISHCGFLFITISLDNMYLTITYLYLHGFFKALTFFSLGNLVKVSKGYQDTRKMGQLFLLLPIESILLLFCAVNLGALPFTVGYFYKYLLQSYFINADLMFFLYPIILISMLTSVIYVYRLVYYSLFDIQKGVDSSYYSYLKQNYSTIEHSNSTILSSLFIFLLIVFCIFIVNFYILSFNDFIIYNLNCNYTESKLNYIFTTVNINYLIYFYGLFFAMVCFLISVECRTTFSNLKTKNFLFYIICCFFL
jgi:NADH:ubiquinone oxidoreductase subunit 5 (subunit L)/multisubunit Na+/H+ antiporter MnhA subunit